MKAKTKAERIAGLEEELAAERARLRNVEHDFAKSEMTRQQLREALDTAEAKVRVLENTNRELAAALKAGAEMITIVQGQRESAIASAIRAAREVTPRLRRAILDELEAEFPGSTESVAELRR